MRRVLFVDNHIRSLDGHYYELATLWSWAARELGYDASLATHQDFRPPADTDAVPVHALFRTHRMLQWSLGVDGKSTLTRDLDGRPTKTGSLISGWRSLRETLLFPKRSPSRMIQEWSDDLSRLLTTVVSETPDILVINTADDFMLLGLVRSLRQLGDRVPPEVHVVFHFALFDDQPTRRAKLLGDQVRATLGLLSSVRTKLFLHATTDALARQMQQIGLEVTAIPYPTRLPQSLEMPSTSRQPLEIVLPGFPRREKGAHSISRFLNDLHEQCSLGETYRCSLQLPRKKWRELVPKHLHGCCSVDGLAPRPAASDLNAPETWIDVLTSNLSTHDYHQWLSSAELGVFLYDARRYRARCSGVLLEMMIRGVPVIVPEDCWMADQVRASDYLAGRIYQSLEDIPGILHDVARDYHANRQRARRWSQIVADEHSGVSSLTRMGLRIESPSSIPTTKTYSEAA